MSRQDWKPEEHTVDVLATFETPEHVQYLCVILEDGEVERIAQRVVELLRGEHEPVPHVELAPSSRPPLRGEHVGWGGD